MISQEFQLAISEKNMMRVKIMLKNLLLADANFELFDNYLRYTIAKGLDIWDQSIDKLNIEQPPFDEKLLNYQLTCLVNDFTKERINYLKKIIQYLYDNKKLTFPKDIEDKVNNPQYNTSELNSVDRSKLNQRVRITTQCDSINESSPRLVRSSKNEEYNKLIKAGDKLASYISRIQKQGVKEMDVRKILNFAKSIEEICNHILEK